MADEVKDVKIPAVKIEKPPLSTKNRNIIIGSVVGGVVLIVVIVVVVVLRVGGSSQGPAARPSFVDMSADGQTWCETVYQASTKSATQEFSASSAPTEVKTGKRNPVMRLAGMKPKARVFWKRSVLGKPFEAATLVQSTNNSEWFVDSTFPDCTPAVPLATPDFEGFGTQIFQGGWLCLVSYSVASTQSANNADWSEAKTIPLSSTETDPILSVSNSENRQVYWRRSVSGSAPINIQLDKLADGTWTDRSRPCQSGGGGGQRIEVTAANSRFWMCFAGGSTFIDITPASYEINELLGRISYSFGNNGYAGLAFEFRDGGKLWAGFTLNCNRFGISCFGQTFRFATVQGSPCPPNTAVSLNITLGYTEPLNPALVPPREGQTARNIPDYSTYPVSCRG